MFRFVHDALYLLGRTRFTRGGRTLICSRRIDRYSIIIIIIIVIIVATATCRRARLNENGFLLRSVGNARTAVLPDVLAAVSETASSSKNRELTISNENTTASRPL
jgi:hypothetical protein